MSNDHTSLDEQHFQLAPKAGLDLHAADRLFVSPGKLHLARLVYMKEVMLGSVQNCTMTSDDQVPTAPSPRKSRSLGSCTTDAVTACSLGMGWGLTDSMLEKLHLARASQQT